MKVSDLILADYAEANPRGKFTLVGAGFTNITAKKIPYVHSLMFVLVRFKVTRQDVGLNKVEIRLMGEKGVIFKAEGGIEVKPDHDDEQYIHFSIQMVNAKFDQFGAYEFQVTINGEQEASQILRIQQEPQPAQATS